MVSVNSIISIFIILASVASAQNFASIASQRLIRILTDARQPGVPAEKASSEASRFLNDPASFSGFQKLISQASEARASGDLNQAEALTLVHEANKQYSSWAKLPSYTSYSKYVKENSKDFDFSKVSSSVTRMYNEYSPLIEPRVSAFLATSPGKEAATSADSLIHKVATDFGFQKYIKDTFVDSLGNDTVINSLI